MRNRAAQRLTGYMVPDHILVLDAIPLTPNGKLDRTAVRQMLTDLSRQRPSGIGAPSGAAETAVAALWAELLDVDVVGREDTFFALGGDSLIATRVIGRLRAAGFQDARVAALFATPVLRDFAATLTLPGETDPNASPTTVLLPDPEHAHEPFALTDVQAAYHTGRDAGFTLGGVGTWHYSEFDGADVDLDRLEQAWQTLLRRHGMLRAVVHDDGTQQVLETVPAFRIPIEQSDVAGGEQALAALRERMSHQVRDPRKWPLFDLAAVRYPDTDGTIRTRLSVGLDYLVLDALSITTLYSELNSLYADPRTVLEPLELTFRDYLTQQPAETAAVERAQAHWLNRLAELPPRPALPLAREPELITTPGFVRRQLRLDAERWQAIKERSARHGLTPSTVLLAAYGEILAAWSGIDAVTLTLTLFNRRDLHPQVPRVLGDFTSLSLAAYRRADGNWLEALAALQQRQAEDLDHQDVPIAWLLREAARSAGTPEPAAPVVFTSALGVGDASLADPAAGFPEKIWGISQSPQVGLDNQVTEESDELVVTWDAVEELFCDGVLDAMFDAHTALLHHVAESDWAAPVPDLVPAAQRQRRRTAAVEQAGPPVAPRLLHEAFFEQASAEPGRTALVTVDDEATSYGTLADGALRTAAALADSGVRPGDLVAVTLPKGPEQVTAVLGVLAAGATYVPIGIEQPSRRRDRIHAAAEIAVTLGEQPRTSDTHGQETPAAHRVLTMREALAHDPLDKPVQVPVDALAYVVFTSGSTGEPKGVEISHAAVWNTVADIGNRHGIGPEDRAFALSALDFDLSVYDIFGLLSVGGSLLLPTEDLRREPGRWPALVRRFDVTVWNTVPALLGLLLDADEYGDAPAGDIRGLRTALISGDWIGLDLPDRLRARTARPCRFVAMGGATEASVWSNTYTVDAVDPQWPSIPYGRPLTGQSYRVVDAAGRDCPDWTPGELWIGGVGLATGYLGDPARTQEKFPVQAGERWYRTGDLGRFRPDGLLEFLGRLDSQLKISGYRIEAGEIEAALESQPEVLRATVVAVGERTARRLVAFAVLHASTAGTAGTASTAQPPAALADRLLGRLHERVAAYAVPTRLHLLPELPLTANGKVDRNALTALAAQEAPTTAAGAEPPRGDTETALAELWDACLPGTAGDRNANFFTVGGDSLCAMRLVAAVSRRFDIPFPVRRLLAAPTLAFLAADISRTVATHATDIESGEL